MSTPLSAKQRAASRANGRKSTGPATPEGRARSSRNSLRHGLSSAVVVLPHEDPAQFEQLRDSYIQSFRPSDQPQLDLVETMAAARWRLNRLQHIEAKLFEMEMVVHADDMANELADMTEVDKLAWVFDRMANQGKSLSLLIRYEGSLNRSYERAFKQLQQLQSRQQDEPEPAGPTAQSARAVRRPLPEPTLLSSRTPEEEPKNSAQIQTPASVRPNPVSRL